MEVEFHSGHIYRYHDVPEGEYRKLLGADSVGRHLNDNIAERYEMSRLR